MEKKELKPGTVAEYVNVSVVKKVHDRMIVLIGDERHAVTDAGIAVEVDVEDVLDDLMELPLLHGIWGHPWKRKN